MAKIAYISEYRIWCPQCGDKTAIWSCDRPGNKGGEMPQPEELFDKVFRENLLNHRSHDTITLLEFRTYKNIKLMEKAQELQNV